MTAWRFSLLKKKEVTDVGFSTVMLHNFFGLEVTIPLLCRYFHLLFLKAAVKFYTCGSHTHTKH